jgi:hypothetical protein
LFGQPILGDYGVSTRTLRDDYDTFGDLQYLSSIYEIPREKVRAAINFERSLDGQGSV